MNINTINSKAGLANQLASSNSKSAGVSNEVERTYVPSNDRDGDKDNSVAQDSVTLSSQSLKLASTSSVQGANNPNPIPNRQDAQKLVDQLVTSIRSDPGQAQKAFGGVSKAGLGALTA